MHVQYSNFLFVVWAKETKTQRLLENTQKMEGENIAGNVEKHSSSPTPYSIKMKGLRPREGKTLAQGYTATLVWEWIPGLLSLVPAKAFSLRLTISKG